MSAYVTVTCCETTVSSVARPSKSVLTADYRTHDLITGYIRTIFEFCVLRSVVYNYGNQLSSNSSSRLPLPVQPATRGNNRQARRALLKCRVVRWLVSWLSDTSTI